mgnify:CR=1 FL=1
MTKVSNLWNASIPGHDFETTIYYKFYAKVGSTWFINDNNSNCYSIYTGDRKAIILCSANDFYGSQEVEDFNTGYQSNMSKDVGLWLLQPGVGNTIIFDTLGRGGAGDGSMLFEPDASGNIDSEAIYQFEVHHTLKDNAFINISAWISVSASSPPGFLSGTGVQIGLRWLNDTDAIIREDWSLPILINTDWYRINISGVNFNNSGQQPTKLRLVIRVKGTMSGGSGQVRVDDFKVSQWVIVNASNPINQSNPPPPPGKDSDGFPAAALHAYNVLKRNGYSDDNILLMLYHTNDNVIDIIAGDTVNNDLANAVVDIENNDVNASRFKRELNVSIPGSFASKIKPNDALIIYMVDHGSNKILADGNATFHFEADNSYITETEFYQLVSKIDCYRMLIAVDCCFSGNFLSINSSIGSSWYQLSAIFISSAANCLSWYHISNKNNDFYAGSFFFYTFWNQLDTGATITQAYTSGCNFIPSGCAQPVAGIQAPVSYTHLTLPTN